MHVRPLVCAVLLTLAVAACYDTPSFAPDGPTLAFRVEALDGKPASDDEMRQLRSVISRRMDAAGHTGLGAHARTEGGTFALRISKALTPKAEEIAALIERAGTLEFRIEADAIEERKQREIRDASGGMVKPPPEFAWFPRADGAADALLRTPERALKRELDAATQRDMSGKSAEAVRLRESYEALLHRPGHNEDRVSGIAVAQDDGCVVRFEFDLCEDRERSMATIDPWRGCLVAVVLDGRVQSTVNVRRELHGSTTIRGSGGTGFSEQQARELAAVLGSGALPGRLVRVPPPEKK